MEMRDLTLKLYEVQPNQNDKTATPSNSLRTLEKQQLHVINRKFQIETQLLESPWRRMRDTRTKHQLRRQNKLVHITVSIQN